jgi:hypothetical protein
VGTFSVVVRTILANGMWSALIAPFVIPIVGKIRRYTIQLLER